MRKRLPTHPALRRGFSLVELVLVMLIVGVLSAVAIPRFASASANHRLDAAADRVIADLQLAQTRARAASQSTKVTFNVASETYLLDNVGGSAMTVDLGDTPYRVDLLQVKFGSTQVAAFNGYGLPTNAGYVTLQLGSETRTVTLSTSGEVRR